VQSFSFIHNRFTVQSTGCSVGHEYVQLVVRAVIRKVILVKRMCCRT